MPAALGFALNTAEKVSVALVVALAVVVGLIVWLRWKDSRLLPEERERLRRATLVTRGKMGDATLTEVHDDFLFYAYLVRGVEYAASQDVTRLRDRVPPDLSSLAAVSVRYDPKNPANSIVVAEEWSGLRLETRRNG
jgi:hypothetical protein